MLWTFVLKCFTAYQRKMKFQKKLSNSSNILCRAFAAEAAKELHGDFLRSYNIS